MATHPDAKRKDVLEQIARQAMQAYGFLSDFSADALGELGMVQQGDHVAESPVEDLCHLLWVSIDEDDSLDLDQLTAAQILTDKQVNVLVAVAIVGALFRKGSAICEYCQHLHGVSGDDNPAPQKIRSARIKHDLQLIAQQLG